jgi:hypothetical protein
VALNAVVKDRLLNWKFEQAWQALNMGSDVAEATEAEVATVRALAITFGDPGWFVGSMADIVRAAVWFLGVIDDD